MPRESSNPEPSALRWARSASGLPPEAVAKKLNVRPDRILSWEKGEAAPSFTQLRSLAKAYKRPTAAFYLTEFPPAGALPTDFRTLDNRSVLEAKHSPHLLHELRRARDRREWTIEMLSEMGSLSAGWHLDISLNTSPEEAAAQLRKLLGITLGLQSSWKTQYEALGGWRALVEKTGTLCFQARGLPLTECRGFSLPETILPVIVINIKDSVRGRIFTLLHELTHVALRQGGLCNLADSASLEIYCNRVAGAVIFPKEDFLRFSTVARHPKGTRSWSDTELKDISTFFGGSYEAVLVRLLSFGLTTEEFYREKREYLTNAYLNTKRDESGFVPPHTIELSCAGGLFTSVVIESLERNNITLADASEYLHIGFKHIRDAEAVAAKFEGGSDE